MQWINEKDLAAFLNSRRVQGVRFISTEFTPRSSVYAGQVCHGVQIFLLDRQALNAPELGIELAAALYQLYPNVFELDKTLPLIGAKWVVRDIRERIDPRRIQYLWQGEILKFRSLRKKYLLY